MLTRPPYPEIADGLPETGAAVAYARARHAGQYREVDGAPFIEHPLEVAALLYRAGAPDHVIAAGALHDVIEQTGADEAELRARFGDPITDLVLAVSDDERIRSYEQRKAALREQVRCAGHEASMIFAADKIAKVRELHVEQSPIANSRRQKVGTPSRDQRLHHYQQSLQVVDESLGDSPLVWQLRTELARLPNGHLPAG